MNFFRSTKNKDAEKLKEYIEKDAVVIDVRTPMEFEQGHAPNSVLISLDSIPQNVERIKAFEKPVILVCRSGGRAKSVKKYLWDFGIDVINAGTWQAVLREQEGK